MQLTKEQFVATLEALQQQHAKDLLYSANMNLAFDGEVGLYDNHILKDALLKMLQVFFPPVDDHCAISHYCWELNFGKIGSEVELTAEDLWDELMKLHYSKSDNIQSQPGNKIFLSYKDDFNYNHNQELTKKILEATGNGKFTELGLNYQSKHGQE